MYLGKKNLMISGVCIITLLMTNTVFAGINESVANAKNAVQNASESSFKNSDGQLKTAFLDDIEGVNSTLAIAAEETETGSKNSLYHDTLNTLNKLISKTDGCVTNGIPDDEDWIVNCEDALALNNALKQLTIDITALIQ